VVARDMFAAAAVVVVVVAVAEEIVAFYSILSSDPQQHPYKADNYHRIYVS
jgi:hypothetical protein